MKKKEKTEPQIKASEITLDPWQIEALNYEGDLLLCTGRQIGKTYILARKACKRMLDKPNTTIIIVSLTEDQAKLIINMILIELERSARIMIAGGKDKPTQNKVTLKNGSYALARPVGSTGDSIRGFTGSVLIIDEAAKFPEYAFISGEPTLLSTGGEVWMASTPFAKKGYFWDQYNAAMKEEESEVENEMGWKVIHVNAEDVLRDRPVSPAWTEEKKKKALRRLERLKARWSALRYGQEIQARFMDELNQYFSDEWINKVCHMERRENIFKARDYYMGVDIARLGKDETVMSVVDRVSSENIVHVHTEIHNKWLTTMTEDRIVELCSHFDEIKKIFIDAGAGSLGVGVLDHLKRHSVTGRKVEAINNRKVLTEKDGKKGQRLLKEDLYDNLRTLGDRGFLHLLNDEKVRLSLKSIQYEVVVKENQESQFRIFGDYSHIVESLIRAAWCSKEKNINRMIMSFKI